MKLREFRTARGWSQNRLAKEIGVSQTSVSYWELGERRTGSMCKRLRKVGFDPDMDTEPVKPKEKRKTWPSPAQMVAEYMADGTCQQLADKYGMGLTTAWRLVRRGAEQQ